MTEEGANREQAAAVLQEKGQVGQPSTLGVHTCREGTTELILVGNGPMHPSRERNGTPALWGSGWLQENLLFSPRAGSCSPDLFLTPQR